MVFHPFIEYFDLYMLDCGDCYEYVSIVVGCIIIFSKRTELSIKPLEEKWKCNLEVVRESEHYIGADVEFDEEWKSYAL